MFDDNSPSVRMARSLVFVCEIRSPLGAARLYFSYVDCFQFLATLKLLKYAGNVQQVAVKSPCQQPGNRRERNYVCLEWVPADGPTTSAGV
jgi:hypothetical protein